MFSKWEVKVAIPHQEGCIKQHAEESQISLVYSKPFTHLFGRVSQLVGMFFPGWGQPGHSTPTCFTKKPS